MIKSIAVDATHLSAEQATGVENYVDSLLPDLSRELLAKGVEVSWIGHREKAPASLPQGVLWVYSPHSPLWSQRALLSLLNSRRPDLFFTPSGLAPLLYKGKIAVTIHDMAAFSFPEAFTVGQRLRLRQMIRRNARRAFRILVPSHYTASEVERIWGVPADRLAVTPLGFAQTPVRPEPIEGLSDQAPVFLFVGRIERKKNLETLIRAFSLYAKSEPGQLVLAGKDGYGAVEIRALANGLSPQIRDRILFAGYISAGQKTWLLERSAMCLVPCKVEGFGLPVLEAFAAEVPAICSPSGSLPEIGADAVLYADGDDPAEWARQMSGLYRDSHQADRLRQAGSQRLSTYTWQRTVYLTAVALLSDSSL